LEIEIIPKHPLQSPRFYGGDAKLSFFILEDLGPHHNLVEPFLEGNAASAEAGVIQLATSLGKLHASTMGKSAVFENILRDLSPNAESFAHKREDLQKLFQKFQAQLETLRISFEEPLQTELESILLTIEQPGPFLAYIHLDLCPDNVFYTNDELRLIDFEFSHFSHALIDAAYGRMMFPSCWCAGRLPDSLVSKMETAYRTELVKGCAEAQDDNVFTQI
jgi:thiamine kinase-like enzyme